MHTIGHTAPTRDADQHSESQHERSTRLDTRAARFGAGARTAALGYVVLVLVLVPIGFALRWLDESVGVAIDDGISEWLVDRHTAALDTFTLVGSRVADTEGIVVVAAVATIFMVALRRPGVAAVVILGLILELSVFLTVNYIVDRARPDVVRLGSTPSTGSFPSGHAAATVVLYGGLAMYATRSWHARTLKVMLLVGAAAIVLWVSFARVYRGMHHVSDVMLGVANGVACLSIAAVAVRRVSSTRPRQEIA